MKRIRKGKDQSDKQIKGFELMNPKMPTKHNLPEKTVGNLDKIWQQRDQYSKRSSYKDKAHTINICKMSIQRNL